MFTAVDRATLGQLPTPPPAVTDQEMSSGHLTPGKIFWTRPIRLAPTPSLEAMVDSSARQLHDRPPTPDDRGRQDFFNFIASPSHEKYILSLLRKNYRGKSPPYLKPGTADPPCCRCSRCNLDSEAQLGASVNASNSTVKRTPQINIPTLLPTRPESPDPRLRPWRWRIRRRRQPPPSSEARLNRQPPLRLASPRSPRSTPRHRP